VLSAPRQAKHPWNPGLVLVSALLAGTVQGQLAWRNVHLGEPHSVFAGYAVPGESALIAMGFWYPATLWKWNGTSWLPIAQEPRLGIRAGPALALHELAGHAVLFGGFSAATSTYLDETWLWANGSWSQVFPVARPPARQDPWVFSYDSRRARIVLHGGYYYGRGAYNDTWEWDGQNWTQVLPSPGDPLPRWMARGAYDERRGVTVLFGGSDQGGRAMNDLWEWDGTRWTSRAVQGPWPGRRFYHAMGYDARRQVLVLSGGTDENGVVFSDVWEWNGTTWTARPDAPLPVPRAGHLLIHDRIRGVTMQLQGAACVRDLGVPPSLFPPRYGPCNYTRRIWEFDGQTWLEKTRPDYFSFPSPSSNPMVTFDSRRSAIILYGVWTQLEYLQPPQGCSWTAETWEWLDGSWFRRWPSPEPPARRYAPIAFDERRGVTVLFGGQERATCANPLGDTWEWDGANWSLRANGSPGPAARYYASASYDSWRGVTVMVGGNIPGYLFSEETWEWDGTIWRLAGRLPPRTGRINASFAFDRRRGVCVLFGGNDWDNRYPTDVWEWDGTVWTQKLPPGPRPVSRVDAGMAFDERRGVMVLSGGIAQAYPPPPGWFPYLSDTWEWDGTVWTQVPTPGSGPTPGARAMVYDRNRDVIFVPPGMVRQFTTGSIGSPPTLNDTWVLEDSSRLRIDTPQPPIGGSTGFTLRFPADAGRPYVAAATFGIYPGLRLPDGRILPWNLDPLFLASLGANNPTFSGFLGLLDSQGEGRGVINVPGSPALTGVEFWLAGVSLGLTGVSGISNPTHLWIR